MSHNRRGLRLSIWLSIIVGLFITLALASPAILQQVQDLAPNLSFEAGLTNANAQGETQLCGEVKTVTACTGGFFLFALDPCDEPGRPYMFDVEQIPGGPNQLVRLVNPATRDREPFCSVEYGDIAREIYSFESWASIASCSECIPATPTPTATSALPIITPTPTLPPAVAPSDLAVTQLTWRSNGEDRLPREYEPFDLILTVQNNGNSRFDPMDHNYKVKVLIEETFIATSFKYPLLFDTNDSYGVTHLNPSQLPEMPPKSTKSITVSNLRLPRTLLGRLEVTLVPAEGDSNPQNNSKEAFDFWVPPHPDYNDCLMVFMKTVIGRIGNAIDAAAPGFGTLLSKTTKVTINYEQTIWKCEGDRNCRKAALAQYLKQVSNIVPGPGTNLIDWIILQLKNAAEDFVQIAECAAYIGKNLLGDLTDLLYELMGIGINANGVMIGSPAYIIVENSSGQRAGFLDDGSVVQEIQGAQIVRTDELKIVLYPGTDTQTIRVRGTGVGEIDLLFAFMNGDIAIKAQYLNVPTNPSMVGTIDTDDSSYVMQIDENGDGSIDATKAPDSLTVSRPTQVKERAATCEDSGGTCFDVAGSEAPCPNGGAYIGWCTYDPDKGIFKKCCGPAPAQLVPTPIVPEQLPVTGESQYTTSWWLLGLVAAIVGGVLLVVKEFVRKRGAAR